MYCKYCGTAIENYVGVCPACGKVLENSTNAQTVVSQNNNASDTQKNELESKILTWGIIGIAFSFIGANMGFLFPLLGLIFSRIALNRANEYAMLYGQRTGKATVGHHLAMAGFIGGIVYTIIFALIILFYVLYIIFVFVLMAGINGGM